LRVIGRASWFYTNKHELAGHGKRAEDCITKPFTARQLLHGIAIVLGESSEEQPGPPRPASAA
jgi:DNA-binding response OmpR family regulator